jgi:hypothetical protein
LKSREEKLIALKVVLSVQDLLELSSQSKNFKANGVVVKLPGETLKKHSIEIETPFVKEVSWLLFQFRYIFQESLEDFLLLCDGLALKANSFKKAEDIADYLIKKSGKLLS